MSNHPKLVRSGKQPAPKAGKRSSSGSTFGILAVIVLVAAGLWWVMKQEAAPPGAAASGTTTGSSANTTLNVGFEKLKGKWLRPDGGYVIEVKSVDDSGKLDAAYFNPNPIHVAKAEATREGAVIKVFIELRDVNYPGSTYTLAYDPVGDQLKGIYYQAVEQQNFEVYFERIQ